MSPEGLTDGEEQKKMMMVMQLSLSAQSYFLPFYFGGSSHASKSLKYELTLKLPQKLQLYGLYVYFMVHICDFGMLRVKGVQHDRYSADDES